MVGDTLLRRPQHRPTRCNSLTSFMARSTHTEPQQRGIAPANGAEEESLYTSFIRSRQQQQGTHRFKGDAVVTLNDVPEAQARRPLRRSSMSGIETRPSKPSSSRRMNHRRSMSPAKGLRKARSFRRKRSNSPNRGGSKRRNGASKSPKPGSRSRRHKERRSRSPQSPNPAASGTSTSSPRSLGKEQQDNSPTTAIQKSSRSSRGKSPARSSKSPRDKSPKLRRRSSLQYATVKEVLGDSFPAVLSAGDCSPPNDTIQQQQQQQQDPQSSQQPPQKQGSIDDDDCSVPALIDDSLVREAMNGCRHGQQWNLLDDTPGGHTPDDFKVVNGIECPSDDARSWRPSEELEEDDDILCDEPSILNEVTPDYHPVSPIHEKTAAPVPDRFNPEFNSSDVWETELREVGVSRCASGDISLLTDHHYELDTVSELASVSGRSHSLTSSGDNPNGDSNNGQLRMSAMPNRRNMNRRDGSAPSDGTRSPRQGYHTEESDVATGETSKRKHRRKKGMSSSRGPALTYELQSPSDRDKSNSNRTSSSRKRGGTKTARTKTNSISRGSGSRRRVPKVVPVSPDSRGQDHVYSPLSSSMVTTPTSSSRFSSSQVVQHQQQSLSSLRRDSAVSKTNKSLGLHVARRIPSYDDNNSLGASTLSTNFSTTQRTRGDNTVSTRSLFQSERMSISQSLKLPQRRRADSESDEEEFDNKLKKFMELPEESNGEIVGSTNVETKVFPIASHEDRDDPKERRILLKRPSGDGTGLLGDLNSAEEPNNNQKLSSSSHHKSRRSQTRSACKRPPRPPVSTNSFVQLNTNEDGVLVDYTRSPIADMQSPLHIAGSADLAKNWQTPVLDDDENDGEIETSIKALALSSRKIAAPGSPSKSKKKKKRLGLFRRTQSWKAAVALTDSE